MKKNLVLAIAFTLPAALGLASPAVATPADSPFNIAIMASRGQIEGIPGYDTLHTKMMQNTITAEEIIKAAGYESTEQLEREVRGFIHSFHQYD